MRREGDVFGRRGNRQLKQLWGLRGLLERLSVALIVLLIYCISLFTTFKSTTNHPGIHSGLDKFYHNQKPISVDELWETAASGGWRPSSSLYLQKYNMLIDPQYLYQSVCFLVAAPPVETNGYLRMCCNGGLNQQGTVICNAVLTARIMKATLVLPDGFHGIFDVEHFIKSLRYLFY
ncbi:hypothetical protein MKW98_022341, partial [Papaver atlanticum]